MENEKVDTAITHFTNIAAEKGINKSGNQFIIYVDTGPDHFLHAKIYADIASGGAEYLPAGGTAGPINNPRDRKNRRNNSLNSGKFVANGRPRNRTSRRR